MPVLKHACSNISTPTYTACNITIIHCSSGTLYPLQTTLHNKYTFPHCWPFLFCRASHFSSQFGAAWWMQMGTYLIGSVPKMEINGALAFSPSFSKLFWALLSSAVCGKNVNEEGRGGAATAARLIQNSLLQTGPHSHRMRRRKLHGPHVCQCLIANLDKCLHKSPIVQSRTSTNSCSGFGMYR